MEEKEALVELKSDPLALPVWQKFADSVGLYIRTKTKVTLRGQMGPLVDVFEHEIAEQKEGLKPLLDGVKADLEKLKPFLYRYNLDDVLALESDPDALAEEIYRRLIVIR